MRTAQNQAENNTTAPMIATSRVRPIISAVAAIGIFILDTITFAEIAVAVLYVGVVLLSATFLQMRGVVLVSLGCMALTLLSYSLSQHEVSPIAAISNRFISLAVIGVTTFLAMQTQLREMVQREQAGLLDLTHDTVFVRDMNDVIIFWNRGAEELYGWKKREAVGKNSHQLMQTIFPMPLEEITAELLRSGRWEGELVHTKKDGTQAIVASRWSVQRDTRGRPVATLETNNDVTEQKRAEEALRASEEQWKAVFENNPTMYFMVDAAGITLSVNAYGAEQLGYTPDELVGSPVLNVFYEPDREDVQSNVARCFAQLNRPMSWEARKVRKDGAVLWVRETARAQVIGNRPVILVACEDITERKQAEYLTGQVFESSPDGICIIGADYRFQRVNPVYERIWEMPAETIVGKHVTDLVGTELFEQMSKPCLDRCFAGEDVNHAGWTSLRCRRSYLAVSYSPLRPQSERVEAALVITRDLTDSMFAAEALRQAQAELAHVTRVTTLGELTASIAHEVSQPITGAVTSGHAALRWLAHETPDLEAARRAIERAIRDANRASAVVGRIRDLVKKAPPRKEHLDLNEVIGEVIGLARSEVLRHGVSLQTRLAADLPAVQGDRVQLQQVILNLVLNAVEAMSGAVEGEREVLISTETAAANGVCVAVRDSGPGLSAENLQRLFDPFYTTKPSGMGMGLAICRSIIEAHGGRLWAIGNEPRGALFQFTLPAGEGTDRHQLDVPLDTALS